MRDRRAGFTLIEVLVTLLILGLLLSLLYGVLVSTLRSKKKMESVGMREKVRTAIVGLFARDIRGVYTYAVAADPSPTPKGSGKEGGSKETQEETSGSVLPRIAGAFIGENKGDLDTLTFLSSRDLGGTEDAPPASFSKIHYALQPGEEFGLYSLFRGVEPYSTGDEEAPGPAFVEIYDRVLIFNLEYLGGDEWQESWKASHPPRAIRLTLDFRVQGEDEEKETTPFQTVFTIPSS